VLVILGELPALIHAPARRAQRDLHTTNQPNQGDKLASTHPTENRARPVKDRLPHRVGVRELDLHGTGLHGS
jgi:hypothetical protein